jgi:hypothetical protein
MHVRVSASDRATDRTGFTCDVTILLFRNTVSRELQGNHHPPLRVACEKRERVALQAEPFARWAADAPRQVAARRRFSSRNATSNEMTSPKGSDASLSIGVAIRGEARCLRGCHASASVNSIRVSCRGARRSLPVTAQLSSHAASESERRYLLSRAAFKDTRMPPCARAPA